jgi:hypothetical protein
MDMKKEDYTRFLGCNNAEKAPPAHADVEEAHDLLWRRIQDVVTDGSSPSRLAEVRCFFG